MGALTEATIKKLKVNELKAELSKRGLAVKGKKDDLVKRLLEAVEEEDSDEEVAVEEEEEEEPMEDDEQDSAVGTSQDLNDSEAEAEAKERADEDEETADTPDEGVENSSKIEDSKVPDSSCDVESLDAAETADGYVVVTKPADDVADEVEMAAEAQDAVLGEQEVTEGKGESQDAPMEVAKAAAEEEQEVTEGTGEAQETPMDVPETPADASQSSKDSSPKKTPKKSPKKSPKKEIVSSSEKESESKPKESPRKSRTERDSKDKEDSKNGEKEKDVKKDQEKEGKKEVEVKKDPEIPDVLSVVEDEEGEIPEEFETPEGAVRLDPYITDINFVISNNGTTGHNLVKNGFTFMWAGSRASKGAKGGKIGYELKVISLTPTDLPANEAPINAVRIGWSSEYASLQLGESSLSYGFESTGKVCASSSFFDYGDKFTEGDVIGTYLDLESEPKTLRYTKNGEDLGVAMSLTVNLEEKPLFPHIYLRNMKVELNFGGNEEPWFPTLEGYTLLQNAGADNIADRTSEAPAEFSECEVLLMVGLPSAGKTTWVKKYVDTHPKKHFNVFGVKQVMDRCKLEGRSRKRSDPNADKLNKAVITVLTKLYQLGPKRKRNFIFDQCNVYKIAQETKMTAFKGFKRKAVLIVPVHDGLRKRTSDSKRRGDNMVEIPFGDLCDMKCEFNLPEVGDFFEEIMYPELDEKNTAKTIRDYHSDGSRAKRTGRDEQYAASKRKRYEDQRSSYDDRRRDNRFPGSGGRHDSWKGGSSGGYGCYDKGRSHYQPSYGGSPGGYNKPNNKPNYSDPYRRNSGGSSGGYRQQSSYGSTGGGYRGNTNYNTSSYGSSNTYGNQQNWNNQYQNQNTQNQQWGSTNWGNYSNYNNSGNYRGGSGGGYSY